MATTKCCSGGTCDSIVTIGYMREMAKKRFVSGTSIPCVSVSSATSFSSCCTADESAYTPTYGEITGETYAQYREIANDPANDVDGFSAYTQTPDTNCCEISVNEKVIPQSALTFGYTEISGITLDVHSPTATCDTSWSIKKKNVYLRHTFECNNDSIVEIGTGTSATSVDWINVSSGTLTKNYTKTLNYDESNKEYEVSFTPHNQNIISSGSCGYSASTYTSISKNLYNVSIWIDCDPDLVIDCDGGEVSGGFDDLCGDLNFDINEDIYYMLDGNKVSLSAKVEDDDIIIAIPPNNEDKTSEITVIMDFNIGTSGDGDFVRCTFKRENCEIGPSTQGDWGELWNVEECWGDGKKIVEFDCKGGKLDICEENNT